jgi:hypothetical protein
MFHRTKILTRFDQSDCQLNPGEMVEESGVYEICHSDEPRATVLLLRNSFFPYCRQCGDTVRFKLVQAAPHISEDPDFMEEAVKTDNSVLNRPIPTNEFPRQLGMAHGFRFLQNIVQAWRSGSESGDL